MTAAQEPAGTSAWMEVLDVPVDLMTAEETRGWLQDHLETVTSCAHVVTLNPEYVMSARRDRAFAAALREADLTTVDGAGVALAIRLLGNARSAERVTGVSLCWMLAEASAKTGEGIFLLGAGPGVADRAAARLRETSPEAVMAGTWSGGSPRSSDDEEAIRRICDSGASIVLVAYGAPAQIHWIARNRAALDAAGVKLVAGIGGALDYISGNVPLPPRIVRKLGLEWAFRLVREPWRWKRQLVLPYFVVLVLRETVRQRSGFRVWRRRLA